MQVEQKIWYCVVNRSTLKVEGKYSTVKRARRKLDKVDNEYGGYIAKIELRDNYNKTIKEAIC